MKSTKFVKWQIPKNCQLECQLKMVGHIETTRRILKSLFAQLGVEPLDVSQMPWCHFFPGHITFKRQYYIDLKRKFWQSNGVQALWEWWQFFVNCLWKDLSTMDGHGGYNSWFWKKLKMFNVNNQFISLTYKVTAKRKTVLQNAKMSHRLRVISGFCSALFYLNKKYPRMSLHFPPKTMPVTLPVCFM